MRYPAPHRTPVVSGILALVTLCTLFLTACGSSSSAGNDSSTPVTSALGDYQKALVPLAEAEGYQVVTSKP